MPGKRDYAGYFVAVELARFFLYPFEAFLLRLAQHCNFRFLGYLAVPAVYAPDWEDVCAGNQLFFKEMRGDELGLCIVLAGDVDAYHAFAFCWSVFITFAFGNKSL